MFYIKSKISNFEGVWANSLEDDFLKFVPAHVTRVTGVAHKYDDLEIKVIDEDPELLKYHVQADDKDVSVNNGDVYMGAKKCKVKKLKKWPYNKEGKFLGHDTE